MVRGALVVFGSVCLAAAGLASHTRSADSDDSCPARFAAGPTTTDHVVRSFDATPIAITVFRPAKACPRRPVPVVLTLHGWGGTRDTAATLAGVDSPDTTEGWRARGRIVRALLSSRFGVVGIDARGHGASGGEGSVLDPAREVRDFRAVIDWIHANLSWVQREGKASRRDIRVGAVGGSFGGAFQLMTAAFDSRLDALVPVVTWNDLSRAVAPHGAVGESWTSVLDMVDDGRALGPALRRWTQDLKTSGRPPGHLASAFRGSSPAAWKARRLEAPVLLVQGMRDPLVGLNEAVENFTGLRSAGANAWLWTFNGPHLVPDLLDRNPAAAEMDPCRAGRTQPPALDFLKTFLRGDARAKARFASVARVSLATDEGTCLRSGAWPVVPDTREIRFTSFDVPAPGNAVVQPVLSATAPATVVGGARARAWALAPPDEVLAFGFQVVSPDGRVRVLEDLETLVRTRADAPSGEYRLQLPGVATVLQAGDRLSLRVRRVTGTGAPLRIGISLAVPVAGG